MQPHDTPKETRYGYCECGCGQLAPIATRNRIQRGQVKGRPVRFIVGHNGRGSRNANYLPILERFWAKVDKRGPDDCWLWTGAHEKKGYGYFVKDGKNTYAHRFSWEIHFGPVPEGMLVCHNCPDGDQPACTNPSHLWLGTTQDNVDDRQGKGRQARGERQARAKLTEDQVREIRRRRAQGERADHLAKEYGVTGVCISSVANRRTWKHVVP